MDIMKRWSLVLCPFLRLPPGRACGNQDLVLTGDVKGAQNKTYFEVPFTVPAGIHRISVDFQYTGKRSARYSGPRHRRSAALSWRKRRKQKPLHHQRNGCHAVVSPRSNPCRRMAAVSSRFLTCVPQVVSHYRAEIRFNSRAEDAAFTAQPLATGTRWYRGDLHMHTAHSDGSCKSQSGRKVPCPALSHRAGSGSAQPGLHRHHRPQHRLTV